MTHEKTCNLSTKPDTGVSSSPSAIIAWYVSYVSSMASSLSGLALNGEEACEEPGYSANECQEVGCCEWDGDQELCWARYDKELCVAQPKYSSSGLSTSSSSGSSSSWSGSSPPSSGSGSGGGAWTDCAAENHHCSFSGSNLVRYGAGETHVSQMHTDGVSCSNKVFGDPLPGASKRCEYFKRWSSSIAVSCGNHRAATCPDCPQGNGQSWCNGECAWVDGGCATASVDNTGSSSAKCALEFTQSKCNAASGCKWNGIMAGAGMCTSK